MWALKAASPPSSSDLDIPGQIARSRYVKRNVHMHVSVQLCSGHNNLSVDVSWSKYVMHEGVGCEEVAGGLE